MVTQVFDARSVGTAAGMFEAICKHIKYGTNKGNIRLVVKFGKSDLNVHSYKMR